MSDLTISPPSSSGSGAPVNATYLCVSLDATLTNERSISFNATNFSVTDLGAGNTYSINTSQNIDVTASPTFVAPTVQRLIISGSTSSNFINASGTLDNATGDETAYNLTYSVNKLTSGNTRGLLVNGTFVSAPGNNYLLDLQTAGVSKFYIDSAGQLATAATTWTLTTLTSFTMQNILGQPLLYADGASFKILTNPVYIQPSASTGSPAPSLTTTTPAHTALTGGAENVEMLIDMSSTKTWVSGAATVANNRSLRILAPTLSASASDTFTEVSTIYISGPPAVTTANCGTAIGFKLDTRVLTTNVATGIGFQVYAPTGALTNACGSFMGGNVGINSLSPKTWLDIRVTDITAANNAVTCIDTTTRYVGTYIGGTQIVTAPASNMSALCLDFGWAPTSNSAFNAAINQQIFTLGGSVNTTGGVRGLQSIMIISTTSPAVATQVNGITSQIQTSAGFTGAATTTRAFQGNTNFAGTGNAATHVNFDTGFTASGANTTTDVIHFRAANPALSGGAVITNYTAIDVLDCTATITTNKIGLRVRGTNLKNWIECDTSFGQASNPGALADFAGKMFITNAGLVTKYNNIATVSNGVPSELATVDLTGQTAAKADTTIYTPTATGLFRISVHLQITTAGTTSVLGGATGVVIKYNDGDGNVAQADTMALESPTGTIVTTSATNTTATNLTGSKVIYARTGVAITYAIGYTSTGTAMQYAAHLKVEAL